MRWRMLDHLKASNRAWAERKIAADPGFFKRLEGQQAPQYLWIGCADSRVPANEIVDLDPGELFVHRNVANLAPPQDANYLSVLQFAIDVLKVKHIMVVGHYGCGGIAAAIDGKRRGLVDHWLHPIREVFQDHRAELDAISDVAGAPRPAVRTQCDTPGAQRRIRRLRTGRLGARPGRLCPRLGVFAVQRPGERSQRDGQPAVGADGALQAARVNVGRGVAPPM